MRSVYVFLRYASEDEVTDYLTRTYPFRPGPPWVMDVGGDPALYIDMYRGLEGWLDDVWLDNVREGIIQSLGSKPTLRIEADISGRHPEDEHSRAFVCGLLKTFDGMAMDENTYHCWSIEQIMTGYRVEGHTFNDYLGWYEENGCEKT